MPRALLSVYDKTGLTEFASTLLEFGWDLVASGGTVSAGNSPGTLTVSQDYTLNAGSTSVFELGTPGVIGGTDNDLSWSHAGDPARQRAAARTALALTALSAGTPMITGGDERLRTQRGNNNAYNLDSPAMWIDWADSPFVDFTSQAFAFRAAHPVLRPKTFWTEGTEVVWLREDGTAADAAYLDDPSRHFLAWKLEGMIVAYNSASTTTTMSLPPGNWSLVADTSEAAEPNNWHAPTAITASTYALPRRTVAVFVPR